MNLDKLKELHTQGKGNREIARELGIHHTTVGNHLKKLGLKSNTANQPIDMVSATEARCKLCQEIKSVSEFQYGRKGQKYEYRFSYCNVCRKKQVYLNLNKNINSFLSERYHRTKLRAEKLGIDFSISKEDFIQQYHNQNGKCFYTEEEMVCEVGNGKSREALSVDKIVPMLGYTKYNVVFCCNKINTCKSDLQLNEICKWMPPWWEKIVTYYKKRAEIDKTIDIEFFVKYFDALAKGEL